MKKQILTIDDDISIRNLLHFLLKKEYDVITKSNGLDGLLWLDQGNMPDLIIADVVMPELDGYDFLLNIKKSGFFRDIPIIMLSSSENSEKTIKCIQHGADDFVMKPFNPKELFNKIEKAINHSNTYSYEKLKN
jgi:two-component system chemotaxis response regulator CheY